MMFELKTFDRHVYFCLLVLPLGLALLLSGFQSFFPVRLLIFRLHIVQCSGLICVMYRIIEPQIDRFELRKLS